MATSLIDAVSLAFSGLRQRLTFSAGGRTAWSSTVTVEDWNCSARLWYDGQFIQNAHEDAAEVMLTKLRNPAIYGRPRRGAHQHQSNCNLGRGSSTYGPR